MLAIATATATPQSILSAPTPTATLVQEISPVSRVPVAGLPPTGAGPMNDDWFVGLLLAVRVAGLGGGAGLLLWSALVWARRRVPQ